MGGAVVVNAVTFRSLLTSNTPAALCPERKPMGSTMAYGVDHPSNSLDVGLDKLVVGSALFGIGWGIAGVCPGPGIVAYGFGGAALLLPAILAGAALKSLM